MAVGFLSDYKSAGLYVHLPFCKSRCSYCDYCSVTDTSVITEYFLSLYNEIQMRSDKTILIDTLYIGGGTPSFIEIRFIEELVQKVKRSFITDIKEFVIEVNPDSLTEEKCVLYNNLGINRVSMGIQSLDNKILGNVKRIHTAEEALESYLLASKYFENINVDFILGLPGETAESVSNNLSFIRQYKPDHISYYIYDNSHDTLLKRMIDAKLVSMPDEDLISDWLDEIYLFLEQQGYERYEISCWAKNGKSCLHNKKYWQNLSYLGIGASAGGHLKNLRYVNTDSVKAYIESFLNGEYCYSVYSENSQDQEFIESIFMGLRLLQGVDLSYVKEIFGNKYDSTIYEFLNKLRPYLIVNNNCLKLTENGLNFSNFVFEKILEIGDNLYGHTE